MRHALALLLVLTPLGAVSSQEKKPRVETALFDGKTLAGWKSAAPYFKAEDGVIVGSSKKPIKGNHFLWWHGEVADFHLVMDVKLEPKERNAGIQFRSQRIRGTDAARGYQADVGMAVWGKLYHERGRGKLDWSPRGDTAVKHDEWNRYEILAVGSRIWMMLNGELCVAYDDPKAELKGKIALQIHGGPPQTVRYRPIKLTHDPKVALPGYSEKQLIAALSRKKGGKDERR